VRGRVEFDNDKLEDFVIVKSNGGATFYLANTVDDLDERISHVMRADEHLPNTPKNQLLWQALAPDGPPPPVWAHVPVLVNEARKKLSKRRDKVALESFREEGYLPEAMANYLCLLGWSPGGDREFLTRDEMLALFRLEDVGVSPAFFDVKKLTAFNEHYLRSMSPAAFFARFHQFEADAFAPLLPDVQTRVSTLADVAGLVDFLLLRDPPHDPAAWARGVANVPDAREILVEAGTAFADVRWDAASIRAAVGAIADKHGLKLAKAQAPIRVAVTGRTQGLPLFESLEVLGRARALARIDDAARRAAAG